MTMLPLADSNMSLSNVSNSTTTPPNIYMVHTWTEFMAIHCPVALMIDRFVTPVWYLIGLVGNSLAAKVWLERPMRKSNSSAIYLATLSITDLIFLLLHLMTELKFAWAVRTYSYPGLCEFYFMFFLIAQYLSPLLVMGFTVERYIAVCHPFKKEKYCTSSRAHKVVILLVILCVVLSSMQAYFWTFNEDTMECAVRAEAIVGGDTSLMSVWTWITEMLIFLVVPLVILSFNVLVIREVRRLSNVGQTMLPGQSRADQGNSVVTTVMLLSVSFFLIFTTLPATIVYVLAAEFREGNFHMTDDQIRVDSTWQRYLIYLRTRKIVEELCLSHYACNFFFYLLNGLHFRRSVYDTVRCRWLSSVSQDTEYSQIAHKHSWHNNHITQL